MRTWSPCKDMFLIECNVGALISRVLGVPYSPKPYSNYCGPYIILLLRPERRLSRSKSTTTCSERHGASGFYKGSKQLLKGSTRIR